MNLDQIATKCFILALFIRDDGQRLLLGDGYYDFNQKLQHFQGNTIANDIVEIQGDNGQLLAGQVMRSGTQKFEGYIGDTTTSRQTIEQKRSDFMAFFRIKHFYKVIYIFPDGTAIQRQRGYLTDAPTIPEIFQKFPEYSVALNFEDANYYEYAEDEHGDEIYAHIAELALAGGATGGLVWDAIGAVTNGITWSGIQTAQGEYIQVTNELDIPAKLASVEMLGKAEQDGTPTPDSPIPVQVVTGENVVKIEGKNIFDLQASTRTDAGVVFTKTTDTITAVGTSTRATYAESLSIYDNFSGLGNYPAYATTTATNSFQLPAGTYTFSANITNTGNTTGGLNIGVGTLGARVSTSTKLEKTAGQSGTASATISVTDGQYVLLSVWYEGTANTPNVNLSINQVQLEKGSSASQFEPFQAQEFEVNLGKNIFKFAQDSGSVTRAGITVEAIENGAIKVNGTVSGDSWFELMMSSNFLQPIQNTTTKLFALDSTKNYTLSVRLRSGSYTESTSSTNKTNVYVQTSSTNTQKNSNLGGTATTFTGADGIYRGWMRFIGGYTFNDAVLEIQLEEGSEQTDYAPYFTPIEIAKIGNYQDRIYKDSGKWYIEKQVGKVVLDGTESTLYATSGTSYAWSGVGTDFVKNVDFLTNYASTTPTSGTRIKIPNNNIYFYDSGYISLADLKTALASTNLVVYAPLATPTTTEITNEALIAQLDALGASSLYLGTNNIGTETQNAVPTLKIEYYTEYTLEGAGYEWEPGGNTAKTIVTVAGVDSAWPIWTVQGGAQNPTLTNITTGQTISWQGFVPEGQTLTINMAEMTADLAGANVFEYITGEWIRLAPGNNTLVYTAGSADKPSTLSWNGVLA